MKKRRRNLRVQAFKLNVCQKLTLDGGAAFLGSAFGLTGEAALTGAAGASPPAFFSSAIASSIIFFLSSFISEVKTPMTLSPTFFCITARHLYVFSRIVLSLKYIIRFRVSKAFYGSEVSPVNLTLGTLLLIWELLFSNFLYL